MVALKTGDATAFRTLFSFLIKCQTIEVGCHYNNLNTPDIICMVLSKLPQHLQDTWNRNTLQLRRKYSKERQMIDIINFVDDEMTLVHDHLYSRDAVSQYVERAPRYSGKTERKTIVADNSCNISQEKSDKVTSKVKVYPICYENHEIEDCTYYLQHTINERS